MLLDDKSRSSWLRCISFERAFPIDCAPLASISLESKLRASF
jgi:hypothetical protein